MIQKTWKEIVQLYLYVFFIFHKFNVFLLFLKLFRFSMWYTFKWINVFDHFWVWSSSRRSCISPWSFLHSLIWWSMKNCYCLVLFLSFSILYFFVCIQKTHEALLTLVRISKIMRTRNIESDDHGGKPWSSMSQYHYFHEKWKENPGEESHEKSREKSNANSHDKSREKSNEKSHETSHENPRKKSHDKSLEDSHKKLRKFYCHVP